MEDEASGDALAPIVAELAARHRRPGIVVAFARSVLRRVATLQLEEADPAATAAALADAFDFVDARRPGEMAVRLTDPPVTVDGSRSLGTVLEVSCDDRRFIVTTVKEELHRLGQRVVHLLHPVYGCERDGDGRLSAVLPARSTARRECFLQVQLGRRVDDAARGALEQAVRRVLEDVFSVTADHRAMRDEVEATIARARQHAVLRYAADEVAQAVELLGWLLADNLVLLGCSRMREGTPEPAAVLGILSRPDAPFGQAPPDPDHAQLLRISPTSELSTVDGRQPIHRIDVVEVGPDGEVTGVFRLVGVFSRKANAEPAIVTPVLRFKLRRILELEDVVEGSEEEATLVSLFQVLPKEELFESDVPALRQVLAGLLAAEDQQDVQVLLRVEPATGSVSALLSVPQELYTPTLRQRLERFLMTQLDGSRVETHVSLGDRADAILRIVVHIEGALPDPPLDSVERELRLLCRTWDQELAAALAARVGEGQGRQLALTWAEWFPAGYRSTVPAEHAVEDVLQLDSLVGAGTGPHAGPEPPGRDIGVVLSPDPGGRAHARFKVYSAGAAVELSRFLPILESLGLWATEERVFALGPVEGRVHLHDFVVTDPMGGVLDIDRDGPVLAEAAVALWHGLAEVDSLNRLVLRGGMSWEDVAVLRAYHRYRNQVGMSFTTAYVAEVLVDNCATARAIVDLFAARFDPARGSVTEDVAEQRRRVDFGCDAVARLDHDRILRGFRDLVDATLRTNRYIGGLRGLNAVAGGTHLALKFDSSAVPGVRRPVPYREIFVYGPKMEGIHLRWGPVARGGIRRSERPDDYRREILGLMRAQVLKNALIVPTGAKGGFVVKRGRYGAAATVDVREAYEIFVTCLLQVTDNVVGGEIVPVPGRRDGDDPYLVVAADRGTAGLSDVANRVSAERGFWLGDAFASGGSHGYDHKRLGITARGAWVAVQQHFAELGIDPESEPTTVAGIGDMSGDVFGNFMTRSDRIRLVAAFDHRDIFLDPDPDPAVSQRERARLFALESSSWQDYDRGRLGPGGGVWSRLVKRIELSPEARAVLGVEVDHLAPAELVRAILQAPVTLLFAGGIGTFVRASSEPDSAVDDRSNTEVRVEASGIRARVVGEGANLAFTQAARVEFARRGGRINTDAIDNSAAVDISDREVNLKILLRPAVEAGEITAGERDRLLEAVCDDVVDAVLRDNAQQSLALSRAQAATAGSADTIEAAMVELEATGVLDRSVEVLPTTEEMRARGAARAGLTRPELAVLLAGAKRSLTAQLLASGVPDQPALRAELVSYFPAMLARRFDHQLDGHRLRRELVASEVANDVVNRMGPTFVSMLASETGAAPPAVASAYWVARGVADSPAYWRRLDDQAAGTLEPAQAIIGLLESLTRTYLRRGEGADIAATVARDRPVFVALEAAMPEMGSPERRRRRTHRAEALVDTDVDPAWALRWACIGELEIAPDVAELVRETARGVTGVAEAFLRIGEAVGIDRLVERLRVTTVADRWSRAAEQGLVDDLDDLRRLGGRRALATHAGSDEVEAVTQFLAARVERVGEATALIRDIERDPRAGLDAVAVATRAIRRALS